MSELGEYLDQWGVVPSFADLYGREATEEELFALVRQYPVTEWLSYLSRVQNLLGADRVGDAEHIKAVFHGALGEDVQERLREWEQQPRLAGQTRLFYERELATLQQYAIMHAPDEGDVRFDTEQGRDDLGRALLMTLDRMNAGRQDDGCWERTLACVIQDQIRIPAKPAWQYAARALGFYELDCDVPTDSTREYLALFEHATGLNAQDAILGGLSAVVRENALGRHNVARGWQRFVRAEACPNPPERRCIDAYERTRLRPLNDIRALAGRFDGSRCIRDWNLIAMSVAPVVDLGEMGAFVLNHTALGRSMFDGVRHTVLAAAHDGKLPERFNNESAIGDPYGSMFESYVHRILEVAFPGRVVKIEEGSKGRADFAVWCPDKVLLVEAKSGHFMAKTHASFLTLDERRAELEEKLGLVHAVEQLATTIRALRAGEVRFPGLPGHDWTNTPVVPLVVTEERTPQVVGAWDRLFDPMCGPLRDLGVGSGPVGRLRLLCVDEAEGLPDLTEYDLGALLYQWGAQSPQYEVPWSSFLNGRSVRPSGAFMKQRFRKVMEVLATRVGLDASRLTPSDCEADPI